MAETNPTFTLWLMGPTSSGKSTLAEAYLERLRRRDIQTIHFDGNEIRDFFGRDLGFSNQDRLRVVTILVHLANKVRLAGLNVIVSALTANSNAREFVSRNLHDPIIGYVSCSISVCAMRDPKGLYAKARSGEISTLVEWPKGYVPPDKSDIILNTESLDVATLLDQIDEVIFNDSSSNNLVQEVEQRNLLRIYQEIQKKIAI